MNKYMEEARAIRASISGLAEGADDEKLIDNNVWEPSVYGWSEVQSDAV